MRRRAGERARRKRANSRVRKSEARGKSCGSFGPRFEPPGHAVTQKLADVLTAKDDIACASERVNGRRNALGAGGEYLARQSVEMDSGLGLGVPAAEIAF